MGKVATYIISQNNKLKKLLIQYLSEFQDFVLSEDAEDLSVLYNEVSSIPAALIFLDAGGSDVDAICCLFRDVQTCKIVVISENPNVTFIVNAVRQGIREILAYPLIKTEFNDVMSRLSNAFAAGDAEHGKGRMITVFSNKGGIGKTSVASNLAFELAQITKENVALVDLNFQFGDIATFLDINPSFDISYMFENLNRLNKDFLLNSMEKYKDTSLYVLADAPYLRNSKSISPKSVAKFFEILKESFAYVVIDTNPSFDAKTITTMDYSDMILLVTIVNMPALRNCQRCLSLFSKLGYEEDKVQILINRYMENDEISLDDVEKLLKKKVYWKIPNNYFALMSAINKGLLLSEVNAESNVAKNYKELAIKVSDSVFSETLVNKFVKDDIRRLDNIIERSFWNPEGLTLHLPPPSM